MAAALELLFSWLQFGTRFFKIIIDSFSTIEVYERIRLQSVVTFRVGLGHWLKLVLILAATTLALFVPLLADDYILLQHPMLQVEGGCLVFRTFWLAKWRVLTIVVSWVKIHVRHLVEARAVRVIFKLIIFFAILFVFAAFLVIQVLFDCFLCFFYRFLLFFTIIHVPLSDVFRVSSAFLDLFL